MLKVEDMENNLIACIIQHNMVCDEERNGFTRSRSCRLRMKSEDLEIPQEAPVNVPRDDEPADFWSTHLEGIESNAE